MSTIDLATPLSSLPPELDAAMSAMRGLFKPTPLHDWSSHDADAFRYLAVGLEPEAAVPPDIPRYSGRRRRGEAAFNDSSGWAA